MSHNSKSLQIFGQIIILQLDQCASMVITGLPPCVDLAPRGSKTGTQGLKGDFIENQGVRFQKNQRANKIYFMIYLMNFYNYQTYRIYK